MAILKNICDIKNRYWYQVEIVHDGNRYRKVFAYTTFGKRAALENAIRWRNKIRITLGIK